MSTFQKSMQMENNNHHLYVFECSYANRTNEAAFLKEILDVFDKDTATMVSLIVNNNIYKLEFHIGINIEGDPTRFENWLRANYPEKMRRHNLFLHELTRHGNIVTLINSEMVDMFLTEDAAFPFIFPDRKKLEESSPQFKAAKPEAARVFLSHSSMDKEKIVLPLYSHLQSERIPVWLDSFEIDYGENIYLKVTEGVEQCELGLFVLTNNFFDTSSGWPIAEFSSFFGEAMKKKKKIIMINAGVDHSNINALMRPYLYIDWANGKGLPEVVKAIRTTINT